MPMGVLLGAPPIIVEPSRLSSFPHDVYSPLNLLVIVSPRVALDNYLRLLSTDAEKSP